MAESIRVLIVDDQDIVREGLAAILGTTAGIEVVGTARDGAEALDLIPICKPDVALMDLKMPGMNGVQATRRITAEHPDVRVLVLTTYDADEWVFDALRAGAAGYLLKDTPREALLTAIQGTATGGTHLDPGVAGVVVALMKGGGTVPDSPLLANLSEREREILDLIARGIPNAEIATRLYLSEGTVKNYVSAIFRRIDVEDRTQAAVFGLKHGLGK